MYDLVLETRSSMDKLIGRIVTPGVAVLTSGWFSSRLALASGIAAAGSGVGGTVNHLSMVGDGSDSPRRDIAYCLQST